MSDIGITELQRVINFCRAEILACNKACFWNDYIDGGNEEQAFNDGRKQAFKEVLDEIGVPYA